MEYVAAALCADAPEERHAEQREVADDVEDFVPHELVGAAKRSLIQHAVGREHYRVLKRAAAGQASALFSLFL